MTNTLPAIPFPKTNVACLLTFEKLYEKVPVVPYPPTPQILRNLHARHQCMVQTCSDPYMCPLQFLLELLRSPPCAGTSPREGHNLQGQMLCFFSNKMKTSKFLLWIARQWKDQKDQELMVLRPRQFEETVVERTCSYEMYYVDEEHNCGRCLL